MKYLYHIIVTFYGIWSIHQLYVSTGLRTTFLWTFGGLFVYFHSRIYSTVGILAAAFGASTLLGVSCNDPNRIGKRDTFDGLMMRLDLVFHGKFAEKDLDIPICCLDTDFVGFFGEWYQMVPDSLVFFTKKGKASQLM